MRVNDDKRKNVFQYSYRRTSHMSEYCLLLTTTTTSSVDNDNEYERKTDDDRYHVINRVYNHKNKLSTIRNTLHIFQLTLTKKNKDNILFTKRSLKKNDIIIL